MTAYKQLSEYWSDDETRSASIIKEIGTNHYIVRVKNDAGSIFSATFENEENAEGYAEEWVQG
jgi:hypothetical protein